VLNLKQLKNLKLSNIERIFKDGLCILKLSDTALTLERLNLIKLKEFHYVKCVNKEDNDFLELSEDKKYCTGIAKIDEEMETTECPDCDRLIFIDEKAKYKGYEVSINYSQIAQIIREKLCLSNTSFSQDKSHIIYKDQKNRHYTLCIIDICEDIECKTSFYYGDHIMYVACDTNEIIDAPNVISLFDLLFMDSDKLLGYLTQQVPKTVSEKIEKVMEKWIDNGTWEQFEDFVTRLLNYIKETPKNYNKGMGFLQKYSGTIVSSFSFKIGGSGNKDAFSVDLYEYIERALTPNTTREYKHSSRKNIETPISLNDFRELLDHSTEKGGVIFTNRNNISSTVLKKCIYYKETNGYWKYIVIHRPLLKLLISLFANDFWDNPRLLISR